MRVTPAVLLLSLVATTVAQSQVRNSELGYTLTLPQGFTAFPEARSQKDVVDGWTEATPTSPDGALVILIARMHGILPREAMRQEDVPANTRVVSFKWKSFDVSGFKTQTSQAGKPVLEGETNWLTSSERAGRLGTAAAWWIGIAVAAVLVLAWRKRRARSA